MFRIHRLTIAMGALLMLFGMLPLAQPAHAQDKVCFPQTNQCIEGRFLEYWRQNGGLPVFGYPVGPARQERNRDTGKTYLTQWFERNRFELHPENARPYDVLLGRLGEDNLLKLGRDWRVEYRAERPEDVDCEQRTTDGKVFLLCGPMRTYYKTHGLEFDGRAGFSEAESLALFGLPLTQPRMETNSSGDRVLTQWFERARMEFHPTKPEPYKLLLGLLGNDLKQDTPPPAAAHPAITYVDPSGAVWELRSNGDTVRLGQLPEMGRVLDAVRLRDRVVVLREQGLQVVFAQGEAATIATFTQGKARFGSLVAPMGTNKILYSYARDGKSPVGFEGVAGVIENGRTARDTTARKVLEATNSMAVLGLTTDEKAMYVVDRGGDPAFGVVRVVQLANGQTLARLPYEGYGPVVQSPGRTKIVTVGQPNDHIDTLIFYDVTNQTGGPRNVVLPREGWSIGQVIWGGDDLSVYALAGPVASHSRQELWRVDPATKRSELVAKDLPTDTRLISVSNDGRWLVTQNQQGTIVIDLTNGRAKSDLLPQVVVIAH